MAPEEARRRLAAPGTGGHKVAVWLLKCDYYEIQVKCCIHCLIVCLAHFDNSHNEQQSQHKIQVLTTNQSDSGYQTNPILGFSVDYSFTMLQTVLQESTDTLCFMSL